MNERTDWISDVEHNAQKLLREFRERTRKLSSRWEVEKHIGYCEGFVDAIPKYLADPEAGITRRRIECSSTPSPSQLNRLLSAFHLTARTIEFIAHLRVSENQSSREWRLNKLFQETNSVSYGDASLYEIPEQDFKEWQALIVSGVSPHVDLGFEEFVLLARRLANILRIPSDWLQQLSGEEEEDALCKMLEVNSRMTDESCRRLDAYLDELRSRIRQRCREAVGATKELATRIHRPEDLDLIIHTAEFSREWIEKVLLDESSPRPSILEPLANLAESDTRKIFGLFFSAHVCVLAAVDHENRHATRLSELGHLIFGLRDELCRLYVKIARDLSAGKEAPNFIEIGRSEFRRILGIEENSDADAMLHSVWFDLDHNVREALSQSRHLDDLERRANTAY